MALADPAQHPHGIDNDRFTKLFTDDRPVVFAFHGYPGLIHRLTYRRPNHGKIHVHGFREEGTTTTPFDMCVMNGIDRFHLALAAVRHTDADAPGLIQHCNDALARHHREIRATGEDMPEIRDWDFGG